jgi:uncharacterized membrane protein YphA (DoxX/SURF4 family)
MKLNRTLWVVQGALALLFVFAGSMKLILPAEAMAGAIALPGTFMRFIGVVEMLGGVGLVLPWLLRIRPRLTPIAAGGLMIIMTGATVLSAATGGASSAIVPSLVGLLTGSIAYARWQQAPVLGV